MRADEKLQVANAARSAHSLDQFVLRRQLREKLKEQMKWLKERDPKRECQKMQGALYAYKCCYKWLDKHL